MNTALNKFVTSKRQIIISSKLYSIPAKNILFAVIFIVCFSFSSFGQTGTCEDPFVIASTESVILDTLHIDVTNSSNFFEFTVPTDGYISFSTCSLSPSQDDFLSVYLDNCNNLIETATTSLGCVRNTEWLSTVQAGERYLFEWDIDYSMGSTSSIITPAFFYAANYKGYNCASAATIDCLGAFETEFSRVIQWHEWIAPASGTFELRLPVNHTQNPSAINILMTVQATCSQLSVVGTNDPEDEFNFQEKAVFSATEGENYYFVLENYGFINSGTDPLVLEIVEQGIEPVVEGVIEVKSTFSDGIFIHATPGAGTYQWYDADAEELITNAVYDTFKPIMDGNYYVEFTSGDCILTSEAVQVTLLNGSGTDCADPFVIDFAGDSVLDTLIVDGSNGPDFFEFTVPANGYMTVSTCRADLANSDHYLKTYFDSGCALQISSITDVCDGHVDMEMQVFQGDVLSLELGIDENAQAENQIDQVFDVIFYFRKDLQNFECTSAQSINCLGEFEVDLRGAEQWYTWTAPNAGEFQVGFGGGQTEVFNAGIQLELYKGTDCGDLTFVEQNTNILFFPSTGDKFYMRYLDELNGTPIGPYIGRIVEAAPAGSTNTVEIIDLAECNDYFFDNEVITESGTYHGAFTSQSGCDSLVTLNLTINEIETNTVTLTEFDSYEFNGTVLSTTGMYNATLTNQVGCDSLVTLNLTIRNGIGWTAEGWSNEVGPNTSERAVLTVDYTTSIHGEFDMDGIKIDAGVTLTISTGTFLEINGDIENLGTVIVESGASILTNEGDYSGNPMTFIRNTRYTDNRYSMVGSPVKQDAGNKTNLLAPVVYSYDESIPYNEGTEDGLNRWIAINNVELTPGIGYAAAGKKTITIDGIPTDGDVTLELGRTVDATTSAANHGWHLVSNPYPAALDINEFITTNNGIQGFVALWDDPNSDIQRGTNADYLVVNSIGSVGGPNGGQFEGYIGSMQGFFVQVGEGQHGQLQFTMDMRSSANNADANFFRTAREEMFKVKLSLSHEESYSETLIGFREDATYGVDRLYDATKIRSQKAHNIYSTINGLPYAIQGLPIERNYEIPLGIDIEKAGTVTLQLSENSVLPDTYEVKIQDDVSGITFPIDINNSLSFDVNSGENQPRFTLLISEKNTVLSLEHRTSKFKIYIDDWYINIESDKINEDTDIRLIDVSGKLRGVYKSQKLSENKVRIPKPRVGGVYIVQFELENQIEVEKLSIK